MLVYSLAGFICSLFITSVVRNFAIKNGVLDFPNEERKKHIKPVPLLGGVAIFLSFWTVVGLIIFFNPVFGINIIRGKLVAAFFASLILVCLGVADDINGLSAKLRLFAVAFGIALSVYFGLDLPKITNPFGGIIVLNNYLGAIFVFIWLLGMTYTTKITDGLDGLASGIVAVGAVMLYFLASSAKYFQPNVALLCLIFFGVMLGFLAFNFYPAKIFLGESGSLFVGYLLGVLAVISGGKVAVALIAMAIPVLDLGRVIFVRLKNKRPIFSGDREHLHFRLVDLGWPTPLVTIIYYFTALLFGFSSLYLSSIGKIFTLIFLVAFMVGINYYLPSKNAEYGKAK